ncbi:hypothetical protein [Novosphingobium aquimarinum]|uniref:hypothetical protein n=1 Tax=Novosphingobium aquimarinum TaxID=2682494 RepID=UPI0012EBFB44|nr:hypothetical protein [Novosphingobium aquimarinum]
MNIGGNPNKLIEAIGGLRKPGGSNVNVAALSPIMPVMQKAAYIAALSQAIEKAQASPQFNLETQKNDLWIKLGNIGANNLSQTALASQAMADMNKTLGALNTMISATSRHTKLASQVIRDLKI